MSADGHGAFDLIFGETARWTRVLGFLASSPRWLLPTGPPWRRNFHSRRSRRSSARSTATRRTPPTRSSTSNGNTTSAMPSSWPPIAASIRGCRARGLESSYRRSISCRTRRAVVINLGERRLYYFPPDGKHVETFPIGVGVEGKKTLIGTTTVVAKEKNPTWFPPPSIHQEKPELPAAVPAGPDNPLGAYAFRLGWANYLIHGTNKPDGVGRNVSHGCIHLYPEDIEHLFSEIPIGTSVRVVDQPVLTAWIDGQFYVAVHPSQSQTDEIDLSEPMTPEAPQDLVAQVTAAAAGRANEVDWDAVNRAGIERSGIPVAVLSDAPVISSNNVGVAPQQSSAQQSAPQAGSEPPVAAAFQYVPGEEPRFFPAVPPGDREAASRVE